MTVTWSMKGPKPRPIAERFWPKVRKTRSCWLWTAACDRSGYGKISLTTSRPVRAHRVAYELLVGPIPPGMFVLHHCDNPACVRPSHLFLGTQLDNVLDAKAKGRTAIGDRNGSRTHPEALVRGEDHGIARLTDAKVRFIRGNWPRLSMTKLARKCGVAVSTISNVVNRVRWTHI